MEQMLLTRFCPSHVLMHASTYYGDAAAFWNVLTPDRIHLLKSGQDARQGSRAPFVSGDSGLRQCPQRFCQTEMLRCTRLRTSLDEQRREAVRRDKVVLRSRRRAIMAMVQSKLAKTSILHFDTEQLHAIAHIQPLAFTIQHCLMIIPCILLLTTVTVSSLDFLENIYDEHGMVQSVRVTCDMRAFKELASCLHREDHLQAKIQELQQRIKHLEAQHWAQRNPQLHSKETASHSLRTTASPTRIPTARPTANPSASPTKQPTIAPTTPPMAEMAKLM